MTKSPSEQLSAPRQARAVEDGHAATGDLNQSAGGKVGEDAARSLGSWRELGMVLAVNGMIILSYQLQPYHP